MDILAHLESRHLQSRWYRFNYDDDTATFYLYNLSGQITGYHQYRPNADKTIKNSPKEGRYFTYGRGVWGLECCDFSGRTGPLFITEGIFDACRLHNFGLSAIATLSNDVPALRAWIRATGMFSISICDNDIAGKKLAKLGDMAYIVKGEKDLGDMTHMQVYDTFCEIRHQANELGYYGRKYGVHF